MFSSRFHLWPQHERVPFSLSLSFPCPAWKYTRTDTEPISVLVHHGLERERERKTHICAGNMMYTHTHTEREREREKHFSSFMKRTRRSASLTAIGAAIFLSYRSAAPPFLTPREFSSWCSLPPSHTHTHTRAHLCLNSHFSLSKVHVHTRTSLLSTSIRSGVYTLTTLSPFSNTRLLSRSHQNPTRFSFSSLHV